MNELSIFSYQENEVRTVTVNGEPWFVAKDVCEVLGISNTSDTLSKVLDDDEKGVDTIYTPGGNQQVSIVNEPGLYSLILRSRKPEAKAFKRWITHEVLPTIRRTGGYTAPSKKEVSNATGLLEVDKAFRAALRMAKAIGLDANAAIISANQLTRKVTGSGPLELLEVKGIERPVEDHPLTPTDIGKLMGNLSGQAINALLCQANFQNKVGKTYVATEEGSRYAVLVDTGKLHGDGAPVHQLKWKRQIVDRLKVEILDRIEPEDSAAN